MFTINVKRLAEAVMVADAFKLLDMNIGAQYLYDELYGRLSRGEEARLSNINFEAFELDDVDTIRELYSNMLETNEYKSEAIVRTLRGISPVMATAAFV